MSDCWYLRSLKKSSESPTVKEHRQASHGGVFLTDSYTNLVLPSNELLRRSVCDASDDELFTRITTHNAFDDFSFVAFTTSLPLISCSSYSHILRSWLNYVPKYLCRPLYTRRKIWLNCRVSFPMTYDCTLYSITRPQRKLIPNPLANVTRIKHIYHITS